MNDRGAATDTSPGSAPHEEPADVLCGLDVLEALADVADGDVGRTISELAVSTMRDRGLLSRLLDDLVALGYAERDETGRRFRLGWRLFTDASQIATARLTGYGRSIVGSVATRCGESAYVVVRVGRDAVTLCEASAPDQTVQVVSWVGRSYPITRSDAGPMLLSGLTPAELDVLVRDPLAPSNGRAAPTTAAALRALVAQAGTSGVSVLDEQAEADVASVAVPIHDLSGSVVASLVVSGPVGRVRDKLSMITQVCLDEALGMSAMLGGGAQGGRPQRSRPRAGPIR